MRGVAACALALGLLGCADAKTLCMLGDSITYGYISSLEDRTVLPPAEALEALLRRAPAGHPWRRARVRNFGVSASWSGEWVDGPPSPSWVCASQMGIAHVRIACESGSSLLAGVRATGVRCDGWLVAVGLNDWLGNVTVAQSADNLARLAALLEGPVWIAAPTHVTPGMEWPIRRRDLRRNVARLIPRR